ncbi:hypothetical protein ACIU1J_32355 [Azospirillum doebereinerae]|uniref:hypothetical protein n=1 Tax=Azospirillum doebereinerae TaxID=92933 RepID=UPI001EE5C069|nr:hypothetical protein [Azospirillum doebereinerae]MCG5243972.1 hypothetical protein [Azospirillum doebereinerae]
MTSLHGVTEIPGPRVLPFAGGLMDQPACVLDALKIMDAAAAAIPAGNGGEE